MITRQVFSLVFFLTKLLLFHLLLASILSVLQGFPYAQEGSILRTCTAMWEENEESDLTGYRLYNSLDSGQHVTVTQAEECQALRLPECAQESHLNA